MFIFHEGLPRSGKSYEAMAEHVIAALAKGRHLYTNMEGIEEGASTIAPLIDKSLRETLELIHVIKEEDVLKIHELKTVLNAIIVIDEMQDYWPSSMRAVHPETLSYIAKHGHYGHDIIGMGQNIGDVNKVWRNRTHRKVVFSSRT